MSLKCPSHYHIYRSVTRNVIQLTFYACEVDHSSDVTIITVRNAECGMRNAECGMRNAECGMRNKDELRILKCQEGENKTAEPVKVRIAFSPLLYAPLRYPRRSKTHQQVVRVLQLRIMYLTSARSIEPTCPSHYHIYRSVTRNIARSIESACEVGHRRSVCLVTGRGIHQKKHK